MTAGAPATSQASALLARGATGAMAKRKARGKPPPKKEKVPEVRKDDVYEALDSDPDEVKHAGRFDVSPLRSPGAPGAHRGDGMHTPALRRGAQRPHTRAPPFSPCRPHAESRQLRVRDAVRLRGRGD